MSEILKLKQFDDWLKDEGPAALVISEPLHAVTGGDAVIFPPTYAPEKESSNKKSEYVIDHLRDGRNICQIDSVGSQANRLEPIFKFAPYNKLVPQVTITVGANTINLLDAGHRAADAVVRFSSIGSRLKDGFESWLRGDASMLASVAPTSLVFGAWDSRGTQAKTPRILTSCIRAYDVEPLSRSAQYIPPVEYSDEVLQNAGSLNDDQKSEYGLTHVPAPRSLGGVLVRGEILRETILNLVSLRAIGALDGSNALNEEKTLVLRRYILGLCLVAITKPLVHNLRQGCLLVGVEKKGATWKLVHTTGKCEDFQVKHEHALAYAEETASQFMSSFSIQPAAEGGFPCVSGEFDPRMIKATIDEKAAKPKKGKGKKGASDATSTGKES